MRRWAQKKFRYRNFCRTSGTRQGIPIDAKEKKEARKIKAINTHYLRSRIIGRPLQAQDFS